MKGVTLMLQRRAALFFLFITLPVVEHMIIVPAMYNIAGRDAWISAILAFPIGLIAAYTAWKLMNIEPGVALPEITTKLWGSFFGKLLILIWGIYFFLMGAITLTSLFDMIQAGFYTMTPMWFIGLSLLVLVLYSLNKGIKVIAWIAGLMAIFLFISGNALGIILMPNREWAHLKPFLEFGWAPVISGAILLSSIWTEILAIPFLRIHKVETKGMLYILFVSIILNSFMTIALAAGTVANFGFEQTDNMLYPSLSSIRIVELGFIDRFDIFGLILMGIGSFIRLSLYIYLVIKCLPKKVYEKYYRRSIFIIGGALFFFSLYIYRDKLFYQHLLRYYVLTLGLWLLPLLYLFRSWQLKRKNNR